MHGLSSHLDQGYLGAAPEAGTAADAANQADPTLRTTDDTPMPVAPLEAPKYLGLTRQQWIILLAAAGITYMLLKRKKR